MSYHSMGNALKAFRNGSLGADATYVYGGSASTSSGISLPKSGTLTTTTSNDYGNLATLADPLSVFTGAAEGGGVTLDQVMAARAAAQKAAIDSGATYLPGSDSSPKIVLMKAPTTPQPVTFVADGKKYSAPPGAYVGHDPAGLYCQAGNTAPCACATQELKDFITGNGLCTVTTAPSVRGVGAATAYSAYGSSGQPAGTFKWFDKWFTSTDDFNPCQVLRLPTCKVDCNAPWYEPVRLAGNYGYCKSTRVDQTPGTAYTAYTPRTPVQATPPACPKGKHASSGGCVDDLVVGGAPATAPASSSFLTGGWWLLLLAAAGGGYYLYTQTNKKKGGAK